MGRYRTIVADPPWPIAARGFVANMHATGPTRNPCPYPTMSIDEIAGIQVTALAENDSHLYLWTTNQFLETSYRVARAWGFRPVTMLVWCKAPKGRGLGGTWANATEYVLFAKRGAVAAVGRHERNWWQWPRGAHSAKPEAFLDLVEQVSPGPYVELFARRARFGWDYWGDQSLGTVELPNAR